MRDVTIAGYLACLIAAGAIEAIARARPPLLATLGELLDVVLAARAPRITLVVFWWWIGWHFLVVRTIDPPLG